MKNLKTLSDSLLLQETRAVAKEEQRLWQLLIDHLMEVDDRKLYATLGHAHLFGYVTQELGYSEATAYERIRAMRLARAVPEARDKLSSGELSLTNAAQLESYRKREKLTSEETSKLVEQAAGMSTRAVEKMLLAQSPEPVRPEKIRQVTPEVQEARIILTPELQALITRYEELHGKQKVSEILENLLTEHLEHNDPLRQKVRAPKKLCVKKSDSRYVSAEDRRKLWARSRGVCEWRDSKTGKRCSSRHRLQMDHYPTPYAMGGKSVFENLRLTCAAHNARFAVEIYGVRRDERREFQSVEMKPGN